MRVIAFTGGYGCGKSTAIKALEPWVQGRPIVLVKFAQVLYDIQEFAYSQLTPVYKRDASFIKDRKFLQWVGTEWGRGLDESLWVNLWKSKVEAALAANPEAIVVCDDCRFDNEGETVKKMGGAVIKLERNNNAAHAQGGTGIKNHASEAGLAPNLIDYIVENNSTLQDFQTSLSTLFSILGVGADDLTDGV